MFNGIIYNVGKVIRIDKRSKGINLFLKSNLKLYKKKTIGMSISCDGVCLTLISKKKNILFTNTQKIKLILLDKMELKKSTFLKLVIFRFNKLEN